MAQLTMISDPNAVLRALAEFRSKGRTKFLAKYGFRESRDYFVKVGDELFDSKPILAAAFGYEYPDIGALRYDEFNGGAKATVRALQRLNFDVVTAAQTNPPKLGMEFANRTDVYEAYGGNKQAGIIRFPGDPVVNVFSDASGPYADEHPSMAKDFGYRGEGLNGPHSVAKGGNALLEEARLTRAPVRFWYKPRGGAFAFLTWVIIIGRVWVPGIGQDKLSRPEIEWRLRVVPGPDRGEWLSEVIVSLAEAEQDVENDPEVPEARTESSYNDLLKRVENRSQARRRDGTVRVDFARSAAARRAVIVRSNGKCENQRCTGMPAEMNRRGEPILDVDHILDLALGGDDHPSNMVALCPNCHAVKTRGAHVGRWRTELARAVQAAHEEALRRTA